MYGWSSKTETENIESSWNPDGRRMEREGPMRSLMKESMDEMEGGDKGELTHKSLRHHRHIACWA
jgi:hypothetical protein